MDWGRIWPWGNTRQGTGRLGDTFMSGLSQLEWSGHWFWNLGRDSPVLGSDYCEESRRG